VVGAVEVAAGEFFSAALLGSGQVIVWGSDASGVVHVPAAATNVVSLRAGALHLVALRADGTVVAWGSPSDGRTTVPVGLNRVIKIAAGRAHSLALRDDGTVVAWGYGLQWLGADFCAFRFGQRCRYRGRGAAQPGARFS
ncbi:MAG: hypothetical protein RIS24_2963, partial [Verrucomicrobiota bacterium]